MSRQCQSCGMPLFTDKVGDCRGSESNGAPSDKWCRLCYVDGRFVDPGCTLPRMTAIVDKALIENGSGRLMRWMARRQLPRLERWRG